MHWIRSIMIAVTFATAGCASLDANSEMRRSAQAVEAAAGVPRELLRLDDQAARDKTSELLAGGLTSIEAAQIALLNNPRARAALLSIGVSRADFVQATLFTNPTLTLSLRIPDGGGLANFEMAFTQNIAELWLIPARKRVAQRALDRSILEAAQQMAAIALTARSDYVRAVRAARQRTMAQEQLAIAERLVDLAQLRQQAGSGNEIDVNLARSQQFASAAALREAELAQTETHSDLARVLGLMTSPDTLVLVDPLAEPAAITCNADELLSIGRANRLDLRIADETVAAASASVSEERIRFLKSFEVGLALERGERRARSDRKWAAETLYDSMQAGQLSPPNFTPREREHTDALIGPTFGMELPLWDQNQAQIAKAEHRLRQAEQFRDGLLIDTAQDIYARLARAQTAAENARVFREQRLPAAERAAQLSRDAYRAGRTLFLAVMESERSLLTAREAYLSALERAALAQIELERATGRYMTAPVESSQSNESASAPADRLPKLVEAQR